MYLYRICGPKDLYRKTTTEVNVPLHECHKQIQYKFVKYSTNGQELWEYLPSRLGGNVNRVFEIPKDCQTPGGTEKNELEMSLYRLRGAGVILMGRPDTFIPMTNRD